MRQPGESTSPIRSLKTEDNKASGSSGKNGGSGKNGSTSGGGVLAIVPDGECVICDQDNKQKPAALSFIYNPAGKNSAYQDEVKAACRAATYPSNPTTITAFDKYNNVLGVFEDIIDGSEFTIDTFSGSTLDSITTFAISGWSNAAGGDDCYIHTSCSQPLVQGDQIGPLIVTAGNNCFPKPPCIVPDKAICQCGEDITVNFNFEGSEGEGPLIDDWVGAYPCDVVKFKHADIWEWTYGPVGRSYPL